jgi:hypothetical protein
MQKNNVHWSCVVDAVISRVLPPQLRIILRGTKKVAPEKGIILLVGKVDLAAGGYSLLAAADHHNSVVR